MNALASALGLFGWYVSPGMTMEAGLATGGASMPRCLYWGASFILAPFASLLPCLYSPSCFHRSQFPFFVFVNLGLWKISLPGFPTLFLPIQPHTVFASPFYCTHLPQIGEGWVGKWVQWE